MMKAPGWEKTSLLECDVSVLSISPVVDNQYGIVEPERGLSTTAKSTTTSLFDLAWRRLAFVFKLKVTPRSFYRASSLKALARFTIGTGCSRLLRGTTLTRSFSLFETEWELNRSITTGMVRF